MMHTYSGLVFGHLISRLRSSYFALSFDEEVKVKIDATSLMVQSQGITYISKSLPKFEELPSDACQIVFHCRVVPKAGNMVVYVICCVSTYLSHLQKCVRIQAVWCCLLPKC